MLAPDVFTAEDITTTLLTNYGSNLVVSGFMGRRRDGDTKRTVIRIGKFVTFIRYAANVAENHQPQ